MDISAYSLLAIFSPLLLTLFLLIKRIRLSYINKKVLNNALIFVNSISLILFSALGFFILKDNLEISKEFAFISIEKLTINLGIILNQENIIMLVFASFIYFLISLYSKKYFNKKKQFLFTKQRYYSFLSVLIFNTYIFITSPNLLQSVVFWIVQGVTIYLFGFFDIFKHTTNYNITRFFRIDLIGNFAFLVSILILYKYSLVANEYVASNSLGYETFKQLTNYMFGICNYSEFIVCLCGFLVAIVCKLTIFPFSCYYSFFANSSNIYYLSIPTTNIIFGTYLFSQILHFEEFVKEYIFGFEIFIGITIITSLFILLFEKNIKIIFGYLYSIINASFLICFLYFNKTWILYIYLGVILFVLSLLMLIFYKDKTNLSRRLINKQKGFFLERQHIVVFEVLPVKIFAIINFIDEKILNNIKKLSISLLDTVFSMFVIKSVSKKKINIAKNLLIIILFFIVISILLTIFWRGKC